MVLNAAEKDALSKVTRTLRERFGATEIILCGSAARGELDAESDIDLLVVLPRMDWEMQRDIIAVCFDAGLQCERVISPNCYTTEEMENSPIRSSPLVLTARREGAALVTDDLGKLIAYRLEQAAETVEAARDLSVVGHYRDAVNRAYYTMFIPITSQQAQEAVAGAEAFPEHTRQALANLEQ
jgi:predicted nucleotidyltransferase